LADIAVLSREEQNTAGDYEIMAMAMPTAQSQVLLAAYNPQVSSAGRQEMKVYQVKDGDTAGLIAAKNGVSANTILWANNLTETSVIKPGDKLAILPVTGIKYKVQKGDSLEAIVNKYNTDKQKVLAYNELPADEKLREGQELILPDGYVSSPTAPAAGATRLALAGSAYAPTSSYQAYTTQAGAGSGHRFPYGYCTWYVAQRKYVPWGGNAGAWLANARASGKATGQTPKAGAIMVSGESRWGHVAVVESVKGNSFTISEMNYAGFGKKSTRTLSAGSRVVRGFIY
jgi:surface antigen